MASAEAGNAAAGSPGLGATQVSSGQNGLDVSHVVFDNRSSPSCIAGAFQGGCTTLNAGGGGGDGYFGGGGGGDHAGGGGGSGYCSQTMQTCVLTPCGGSPGTVG